MVLQNVHRWRGVLQPRRQLQLKSVGRIRIIGARFYQETVAAY